MKQKLLISLFVSIIALHFATAQPQGERVPTTEVIRLVTDAQTKHNAIYNERIKGHEDEQADLRKAIYSANTELMAIRSLLAGNQMLKRADYAKLEKPLAELTSAIQAVEQSTMVSEQCRTMDGEYSRTTDDELSRTISNVTAKAKAVKNVIQKIKK